MVTTDQHPPRRTNSNRNNNYDDYDEDDDNYHASISTPPRDSDSRPPAAATPEDDRAVHAAAAEVAVMARHGDGRGRRPDTAANEALMGAAENEDGVATFETIDQSGELVRQAFLDFLMQYRQEVHDEISNMDVDDENNQQQLEVVYLYPYIEQAHQLAQRKLNSRSSDPDENQSSNSGFTNTLFLNFEHLMNHDIELADAIRSEFSRFEPFLRKAATSFVLHQHPELNELNSSNNHDNSNTSYFVAFHNLPMTVSVRQLRTDVIGSLSSVTATVTRTSDVRPELLVATFRCDKCGLLAEKVPQQYHFTRPTLCRNPRCKNTSALKFVLEVRQSEFVDWQKLRVQENSNQIPPGSMPRSMDVIVRNEMVERAKAGDKCVFTGCLVVIPDGSALAKAGETVKAAGRPSDAATGGGGGVRGLSGLGVRELTYRTCFVATSVLPADCLARVNDKEQMVASFLFGKSSLENHEPTTDEVAMEFTESQRAEIRAMKNSPKLYEQMVDSIAPSTFGHREVKKGILLMLLGGVHKTTCDGGKLRGDINVCVVGDPSTAKSQFLKYVHSFLPSRAVYTSGKASSAAGLTAAVQRDQDTGEYCIEAGALMLADNGICCIDEFDKMDPSDQVAIHEAMEQQTISITKAGIQATLNARASILAAANPIHGRYDRTKTLRVNVALSAPILSRFDLFFVVLDDCNPESDRQVARHILNVHRCRAKAVRPPFTKDQMRRYIRFARTLHPTITPESQRVIIECYRKLRQGDTLGRSRSAYRITVRQLESMIRLSEALARLYCDDEIQPSYVREAFRLLRTSIIQVETSDVEMEEEDDDDDDDNGNDNYNNNDDNHIPPHLQVTMQGDENNHQIEHQEADDIQLETQRLESQPPLLHPGEYNGEPENEVHDEMDTDKPLEENMEDASDTERPKKKKRKKKKNKTKISFEEYEAITHAIAGHLRALEGGEDGGEAVYLKWGEVLDWYLEQVQREIGDSEEARDEMRKKVNLVIRRLLEVDRILVTVGEAPKNKKEERKALLAVHPNYDLP